MRYPPRYSENFGATRRKNNAAAETSAIVLSFTRDLNFTRSTMTDATAGMSAVVLTAANNTKQTATTRSVSQALPSARSRKSATRSTGIATSDIASVSRDVITSQHKTS